MTKECKQQFTLRITQANSTQLIVILYEMTLQYLADGEQAADDAGLAEAVHRARGCIKELLNSLHREYSPAGELSRLYLFCLRRLAVCEVRRDRTILEEIRKVIAPLCDAYRQIQDHTRRQCSWSASSGRPWQQRRRRQSRGPARSSWSRC